MYPTLFEVLEIHQRTKQKEFLLLMELPIQDPKFKILRKSSSWLCLSHGLTPGSVSDVEVELDKREGPIFRYMGSIGGFWGFTLITSSFNWFWFRWFLKETEKHFSLASRHHYFWPWLRVSHLYPQALMLGDMQHILVLWQQGSTMTINEEL